MSLADELEAESAASVGERRCSFGRALDAFPEDAEAILAKCAPGPGILARRTAVSRVLKRHGHPSCGMTVIERHTRSKSCACYL